MTRWDRLFRTTEPFAHPVTTAAVVAIVVGLVTASIAVRSLARANRLSDDTYRELLARTRSWYVLAAAMVVPILLGPGWVCLFFFALSLFCFREYARATGLIKSRTTVVSVVIAIVITYFAIVDHWMGLFSTSWALGIYLIAGVGLLPDQPEGYIRRVSLAIVGFALFGISIGHLAFISNDTLFRPILLWILLCTELNDVFAYLTGKAFGRAKLLPQTSPNKTWGGAIGALVLTTLLGGVAGHFVFRETTLDHVLHLLTLGNPLESSRSVWRPGHLVDQARFGCERHGDGDTWTWRTSRSIRQPIACRAGSVSLHQLF